jgi:hypothetical protein
MQLLAILIYCTYEYNGYGGAGIATGYGLDNRWVGVRVSIGSRIFSSPRHPNQFWGPPSISNGYRGLPGGKTAGA